MVQNNDKINKQKYYIKQLVQSNKKIKKYILPKQIKSQKSLSKTQQMYLCQKPLGYPTCEVSHNNPQQQIPIPKTLNDKKDTTLIEMAMKMFIKQRLYGELQGFYNGRRMNKNVFKDFQPHIEMSHKRKYQNNQPNEDQNSENIKSMYARVTSAHKMSKFQIQNLEKLKNKQILQKSQSDNKVKKRAFKNNNAKKHSISLDISKLNHKQNRRQQFLSKAQEKQGLCPTQRQHSVFNMSSFISQIQIKTQRNNYSQKQHLLLPQIGAKKSIPLDLSKQLKSMIKKQLQPKILISEQIWALFTSKSNKANKANNSNLYQQTAQLDMHETNLKKSNQRLKESGLKKDRILAFIRNQNFVIPEFIQPIVHFFQLNVKFQDKITKFDTQTIFLNLYNQNPRAWAICIFRILDKKKDGKIDSTDLFKFHNYLDQLLNAYETKKALSQSSLNQDSIHQKNLLNQQQDKNFKRQKTQISSVSNNQAKKPKVTNKSQINNTTLRNATNQSEFDMQNNLIQTFLSSKNNENIIELKRQIEKLNQTIINSSHEPSKITLINPQQLRTSHHNSQSQFKYLQQALLKNAQLKISDLNLIIPKASIQSIPKQAIEIDTRKLNIKLSSVYVQTFSATEHNQETRMDRDYVQGLKDKIRNQRRQDISQQNVLQIQGLKAIQYREFYQNNMWKKFKQLFFCTFHALLIENKKI